MEKETLSPPADIQLDKDGIGMFFMHPTEEELSESGNKQWMWTVSNNNPEREYRKVVRIKYFTMEQIEILERVKEHIRRENQFLNNALIHCAEIVFPHIFKTSPNYGNEDEIHEAMFSNKKISYELANLNFRFREFARQVHKGEENEDNVIYFFRNYIYKHMHNNEYFVKYLNKVSKEDIKKMRIYLIGAIRFYHYFNLNYKDE